MLAEDTELELDERPSTEKIEKSANVSDVRLHWPQFVSPPPGVQTCRVPPAALTEGNLATRRRAAFSPRPPRRGVLIGAAALAFGGALGIAAWGTDFFADPIFGADLMRSGPLGEAAVGDERASHIAIEYASLTCPHCAHFFNETFPALQAGYVDTGKMRFILREFPLDALARAAAVLARAAAPESYFPFVQALLRQQSEWMVDRPLEPLFAIASAFGFTRNSFQAAFSDQRLIAGVDWVRLRAAEKFKVGVAPTFFIDRKMYTGAMSLGQLELDMRTRV
jgi:protein-disulfide isomerase